MSGHLWLCCQRKGPPEKPHHWWGSFFAWQGLLVHDRNYKPVLLLEHMTHILLADHSSHRYRSGEASSHVEHPAVQGLALALIENSLPDNSVTS